MLKFQTYLYITVIISFPIFGTNFELNFHHTSSLISICCIDLSRISLRGDATADRHQGLKIFSTSIIRAGALNTGIYIRRVYAHAGITRVRVRIARAFVHVLGTLDHRCMPGEANDQFTSHHRDSTLEYREKCT